MPEFPGQGHIGEERASAATHSILKGPSAVYHPVLSLPDSCPYIHVAVPLLPLLLWPNPQPALGQLTFFQMPPNFYLLSFNTRVHCILTNTSPLSPGAPGLRSVVLKLLSLYTLLAETISEHVLKGMFISTMTY